jgi:uncharacterized membrane protein
MPMDKNKPSRNFFLRGLVALLPAMLTTFAFVFIIQFTTRYVTGPINSAIYWTLERNAIGWTVLEALNVDPLSEEFLAVYELTPELQSLQESAGVRSSAFQEALEDDREAKTSAIYDLNQLAIDGAKLRVAVKKAIHPVVGLLVALLLLMVVGYLASGFLGRRVVAWFDRRLSQIPFVKWIYPYAKQFVEYFLSDSELEFDTVVAAPYPSPGVYCIAFVTSPGFRTLHDALGGNYVACFVPTSPMPMTGYTVFIEASRLIPLPISVDEALRTTISAGVLIPPNESVEELTQNLSAILGRPLDTKS